MDGLPHSHNTQAAEDRLINSIEEIDTIKERYRQAVEYMNWFKPAWNQLSDEERHLLGMFYETPGKNAVGIIEETYKVEKTSAYNKKNRALDHLTTLLYGKA